MRATPDHYENPIAARIVGMARDGGMSLRQLSRKAGLSESTAQKVCSHLESGESDAGILTLTALAQAGGRTLAWLLHGEDLPARVLLRDLEGWREAAVEAAERFHLDATTVDAVGGWAVHEKPAKLDAWYVAGLVRSHRGH